MCFIITNYTFSGEYEPGITFITSVRAHHQRFFCASGSQTEGVGRNVPAGTAISGYGALPDTYHFFLVSQSGVGTVCPTFYQVLYDDNNLHIDNLVRMTSALTFNSFRSTKT